MRSPRMSISATNITEENFGGSDSDTNHEESPEYYQPISAVDDDDGEENSNSDGEHENHASNFHRLPNGYTGGRQAENGMSSLDLNGDVEQENSEEEEEKEEEEEGMSEDSDSAILRAFREDESRRNAPLTPENATRVMEAMRGVSFGGLTPDWAGQVPEDRWIDHLRRLRQSPQTTSSIQH